MKNVLVVVIYLKVQYVDVDVDFVAAAVVVA
jgi:hypothetical protein